MFSRKMKYFSFSVLHDESKLCEESRNYIIAIEKVFIGD